MQHLLSMHALDKKQMIALFDRAEFFLKTAVAKQEVLNTLHGKVIVNLFFEPSTRTRNSFVIAGNRLGAIVLSPNMKNSSTVKGELLIDTIHNLEAMGAALLVIRHPDNHLAQFIADEMHSSVSVVNAGDGSNEHPTQALLDIMTIRQHFPDFSKLAVAIVGDVAHSRVARSLTIGLKTMGVGKIRFIAPDYFTPDDVDVDYQSVEIVHDINLGLKDVDIIYALRIQKERIDEKNRPSDEKYFKTFGLTAERIKLAKPTAIVMHGGPINRGIEIESDVADGPQSVILQQTKNSVGLRMAVLEALLK